MLNVDFEHELLVVQIHLSAVALRKEIECLTRAHICTDCGAMAEVNINGTPYCLSCYREHTGEGI